MDHQNPLISVIVPVFNAAPYLDQCLESIESQSYENLEIICLNDGSTDNSLATIEEHAAKDPRIIIINKENQGYGATCNRGLAEAKGDYISIIEPDDWILPSMYEDMIIFASSFDGAIDIIKTPYWRIWMPDSPQQKKLNCSYKNRIHPPKQPFVIKDAAHLLSHHPSIWSALYRKKFLDKYAIRFKEIPGAGWADNPFLIETFCQAGSIVYLDEPYYCYREETDEKAASFARNNTLLPFERWNDMMDILERLEISDEATLHAHNSRGFTYLSGVLEEVDLSNGGVNEAAKHMFSRMDQDLVLTNPEISPGCKRMFAELLDLPEPKINRLAYVKKLVGQGTYNLKNTGLSYTLYKTTDFLRTRKSRTGNK